MAKKIPLTNGGYALVSNRDYGILSRCCTWKWVQGRHTKYAVQNKKKGARPMHQVIIGKKRDRVIDHINEDGLDNRRKNLRHITKSHNAGRSSRRRGYRPHGRGWQVRVTVEGVRHFIKVYDERQAAEVARCMKDRLPIPKWAEISPDPSR